MKHSRQSNVEVSSGVRRVVSRTRGVNHGAITRLMSPGDLGEILKPFVFLDLFDIDLHDQRSPFSIHPHSGIATITVVVDGELQFGDVAEGSGQISFGGFEWMRAGGGVWHGMEMSPGKSRKAKGFQLWIALGPELEQEAVESQYVEARRVPTVGPAHVILGTYGGAHSPARSPLGITYLLVRLPAGADWTFAPPESQVVAWLAVASGGLQGDLAAEAGEMLVLEDSLQAFTVRAGPDGDAVLVVGSAVPHAHDLHLGRYSVHTSAKMLELGEANIERLRKRLIAEGDRRRASGSVPVFKG